MVVRLHSTEHGLPLLERHIPRLDATFRHDQASTPSGPHDVVEVPLPRLRRWVDRVPQRREAHGVVVAPTARAPEAHDGLDGRQRGIVGTIEKGSGHAQADWTGAARVFLWLIVAVAVAVAVFGQHPGYTCGAPTTPGSVSTSSTVPTTTAINAVAWAPSWLLHALAGTIDVVRTQHAHGNTREGELGPHEVYGPSWR